jgi:SAM-dependent methyltransferase
MGGFDPRWEQAVYGKGRHLNLYPFDVVVSTVLGRFGKVDRKARSAMRFLEVGCGAGNNVWFLAREGFSVAGIDGSQSAIEFAAARLANEGMSAELKVGDISDLPWDGNSFDFVIDREAITHNRRSQVEGALKEVHRVLRPEGLFFSQVFSTADDGWRYGHALGDGAFDHFRGGYFADISLTFFASSADIDALFAPFFSVVSKKHCTITDASGGDTIAMWNVVCSRR